MTLVTCETCGGYGRLCDRECEPCSGTGLVVACAWCHAAPAAELWHGCCSAEHETLRERVTLGLVKGEIA